METPAVHVVRVPLAGYVAHVLQSGDLLLDEHPVPGRFRGRATQRARLWSVHERVPAGPTAPVPPVQPQRPQPGGGPAPDQHVHVVRVGAPAQVAQRYAARDVEPELPEHLERGDTLNGRRYGDSVRRPPVRCGRIGRPDPIRRPLP